MTSIIRNEETELEDIWESMTSWLDAVFSTPHTSHRKLLAIEDSLETLDQELMDLDRAFPGPLTPSQHVAAHRLGLRVRDIETVMFARWRHPAIRRSSLRALRGIHERYLGPIGAARCDDVVFEISRLFHNPDFGGFIEAHRTELYARWTSRNPLGLALTLSVIEGPRWVHDLYRHLLSSSLRGAALRERYVRTNTSEWRRDHTEGHFIGDAIPKPDPDTLETAHRLWAPDEERSPYQRFAAAVEAARLL